MKQGWDYGTLEDAVKKGSSNISLNKIKDDEGDYPVFSAKGFAKNVSFFQQEQEYLAIIKDGAGIGRVGRYPAKSSVVATMQYLILKDGFDIGFVEYFLKGIGFEKHRSGSTIPHVYFKDYKSESFPLIPLPEQQRIVEIMDKAFVAIDKAKQNAEQNLSNAKEVFENYLQGVFVDKTIQWNKFILKDLLQEQPRNGWSPPLKYHSEIGIPVLTLSAVTGFEFDVEKCKYTTAPTDEASYYWLENGNLLISRSNTPELVGHVAISNNIESPTIYPDLIMKMKPIENKVSTKFLYYQLRSSKLRKEIMMRAHGANPTMKKINKTDVQSLPISLCSKEAQLQIVTKLDQLSGKIKTTEEIYQKKINNILELKKSILQKAFRGEL